jgi:membrane peptidoglycan carboxypeptidase
VATGGNCLWDYDFRYPGALSLRYALGGSRNVPAVKAMLTVGTNKVISNANNMMSVSGAYKCYNPGTDVNIATVKDEAQCYGASAIGDGAYLHLDNHVNGLATLARLGQSIPQTYILKIQDAANKTIYQYKQPKAKQAIRPDAAYIVDDMASDANASYLPAGYYKWHDYKGWKNAIKTGTTNNGFDGLMTAWNTKFAVASWVGYHTRNKPLSGAMEYSTTPLTKGFMTAALDSLNTQPENWKEPSGMQHLPGYVVRTHVGIGSREPSPTTEIFPSWYKAKATSSKSQTIDKVSGKVATSCTPESAKQVLGGSAAPTTYSVDIFYPPGQGSSASSSSSTASGSDDVHSCSDSPPTISLTATDNNNGTATLTAFVSAGSHALNDPQYPQYPGTVTFTVNGQSVGSKGASDPQDNVSVSYTIPASGSYNVSATVTDSVLYSASDSKTVDFSGGSVGGPTNLQGNRVGGITNFSWSGGSGPYTVYRAGGTPVGGTCNGTGVTACTANGVPGGSAVYVQDNDGNKSNTITI